MIVVADTTPINYLVQIGEITCLKKLYQNVIVPEAVYDELRSEYAPAQVRDWIINKPQWVDIKHAESEIDETLELLDRGEAEAILIAKELNADLLIIDEKLGRKIALDSGLKIVGTIGVLALAKKKNLIDIDEVLLNLDKTSFFISEKLKKYLKQY